jgi:S-adenosyl-L-methionine methyltransferase
LSRLDSFLRRLLAQRDCLDAALALIRDMPGPILEMGLGNGRTYDHLREHSPGREIFVFERKVCAHPDCVPDAEHLFEGDIEATLAAARNRFSGRIALAHGDLGSGHPAVDARLAATVSAGLPPLMAPGGVIVSDQELSLPGAAALPLPQGVQPGRYFMYRCAG